MWGKAKLFKPTCVYFEIRDPEDEHLQGFKITCQMTEYYARKSKLKFAKFGCNLPPISEYRLNMYEIFFVNYLKQVFEKVF